MSLVHGRDLPKELYKILKPNMKHFGHQWHEGENVDVLPWRPSGSCSEGGLYFTTIDHLITYASHPIEENLIGRVTVDDDEEVWQEPNGKWKAHSVFLSDVTKVKDLDNRTYYDFLASLLEPYPAPYDPAHHKESWSKLVGQESDMIAYARPDDWDVCFNLADLKKRPEEYDMDDHRDLLLMVEKVSVFPWLVKFLTRLHPLVAMAAVKKLGLTVQYVPPDLQTRELCMHAVKYCDAIHHVHDQTEEVCMESIKQNPRSIKWIRNRTPGMIVYAVQRSPSVLSLLTADEQTRDVCWLAVRQQPAVLGYVKQKTPELCELAVRLRPQAIMHVPHDLQTEPMCRAAVDSNKSFVRYVAPQFRYLFVKVSK